MFFDLAIPKPPVSPIPIPANYQLGRRHRVTRRGRFLCEMQAVVPWARLVALVQSKYPTSGRVGRQPIDLERMLRMYFLQQWFGLADEALEDAIYESHSMQEFLGLDLGRETVPDSTTLLKFRHMLERHGLTAQLFESINGYLTDKGLLLREGTLVDASIIAAPTSTKNQARERDPEMHQSKKGNQWYFGMKVHAGADAQSGLVHSLHVTSANESDVAHAHKVLHGKEVEVFADAGYLGLPQRPEIAQAQAQGHLSRKMRWNIALRRSSLQKMAEGPLKDLYKQLETVKARIRARVEHPFHVIKNLFCYKKARYKGVAKNQAQLYSLFGLCNLVRAKNCLLAPDAAGRGAP